MARTIRHGSTRVHEYDESTIQMLNSTQNEFKSRVSECSSDVVEDSIAKACSDNLKRKAATIRNFLEQHEDDLAQHLEQLRKFASSRGGLICDEFRERIWPILAANIPLAESLNVTTAKDEEDNESSSVSDSDFESALSSLSNGEMGEDDFDNDSADIIELPEPKLEDLKSHPEWNQVEMDVNRILARFPPNISDEERHSLQNDLSPLIVRLLWANSNFRYYQGFHDVCLTLILVLGVDKGTSVARSLTKRAVFRQYLTRSLEETALSELQFMHVLLFKCNPRLEEILRSAELGSMFALSWPLTWFSHALHEYTQIVLCFDLFLSGHWMLPIYVCAAVVAFRAAEIHACEPEMPSLHHLLNNIPADIDIMRVLDIAQNLYCEHPPALVLSRYREQYIRHCAAASTHSPRLNAAMNIPPAETIPRHSSLSWIAFGAGALTAIAAYFLVSRASYLSDASSLI
jgi:hypothetical protein